VVSLVASILLAQVGPLPSAPIRLSASDIEGRPVAIPSPPAKATALVFLLIDCPIGNRLAPEIGRIGADYARKGVRLLLVYPDPSATKGQIGRHMREYGLVGIAIRDRSHALVRAGGAAITPSAVVLDAKGRMTYRGRVNDLFLSHGKRKERPGRHDLRLALDETLAGKPVTLAQAAAIGCDIPPAP
jgi:hypothetical protein